MDRATWLAERRPAAVELYDREAPTYDQHEYPTTSHRAFVARLIETCPPGGVILDAGCGTGRYFAMVAAAGGRVVGVDQSAGMLDRAAAKRIAVSLLNLGLQEIAFAAEFDAAMAVDAMEHVAPEDWPLVLANLRRAVRAGGGLYFTVEETEEAEIEAGFSVLAAAGLPAVRGEVGEGNVAGYDFYPGRHQVLSWLEGAGLDVVEEAYDQEEGWGYRHFLVRSI